MIYTENYQLRKPVIGVDNADVNDLNYNSDRIDEIMHSSQISLADAYDINSTYNTGDVVMYEFLMYRCLEDNVTGVWNPEKWTRTTAGEESGGGADLDIYGEASGTAEASFSDGAEASLVECEIGIVPTQDLHGYSKPWAGGAGKNKFIVPTLAELQTLNTSGTWNNEEYTTNGITFKCNFGEDGLLTTIEESGTATSQAEIWLKTFSGLDGNYYFSGGIDNNKYITFQKNGSWSGTYIKDVDVAVTFESTDTIRPIIAIGSGQTGTAIFMPMIRLSSIADNTFEPYSNICPISGHSSVTVTVASTSGGSGEDTTVALGRTVYSGTLNLDTGVLTVDRGYVEYDGSSDEDWRTTVEGYLRDFYINVPLAKTFCELVCNIAKREGDGQTLNNIFISATKNLNWYIGNSIEIDNVADFKTWLSNNPMQVVYELATPQTFNLTKAQVKTLLGQNYVSHDGGGTISLVYIKKDSTIIPNPSDAEVPLTGLEISGKGFKITDARIPAPPTNNGAYVLTVTVSGGTPTYSWENA